jgi:tRNA (guanine37-N1)-methyltransferase
MKIDIITLFPKMFKGPFDESIIKRAKEKGLVDINIHDLRKWTEDKHRSVDDRPFGGGAGMILRVDVIDKALQEIKNKIATDIRSRVILLSAKGYPFNQKKAQKLYSLDHLILIAGHYEGVDERVAEHLVDEEISIGEYVLTGGEIPAMVITDAVVRLLPGVLGNPHSLTEESFKPSADTRKLTPETEYPQYTRPADYKGWKVPDVILSGNHKEIDKWRREQSLKITKKTRPDMLK